MVQIERSELTDLKLFWQRTWFAKFATNGQSFFMGTTTLSLTTSYFYGWNLPVKKFTGKFWEKKLNPAKSQNLQVTFNGKFYL